MADDKHKNKPAKMSPKTAFTPEPKAHGFGWNTQSAYPETMNGTNHMLRMGHPEDNANHGQEHLSMQKQEKSKKASTRRTRNMGRS